MIRDYTRRPPGFYLITVHLGTLSYQNRRNTI